MKVQRTPDILIRKQGIFILDSTYLWLQIYAKDVTQEEMDSIFLGLTQTDTARGIKEGTYLFLLDPEFKLNIKAGNIL